MKRIYLDHTASTPVDARVVEAMQPYLSETFGNASSVHWFGRQAKQALEQSREIIARAIGARSSEIFFTSGGTESNNLAIRGVVCAAAEQKGRKVHIVTSRAEHHAVLQPCEQLEKEGYQVTLLPVDEFGRVDADQVRGSLSDATAVVSIMTANNEVGTISPVAEMAHEVRSAGGRFHTDAVQALGKLPIDVDALGVDLLSLSAHKIYGPKGIGALYVRKGTDLAPIVYGGGQERGKRPGTESVALAAGFAKAVELSLEDMNEETARLRRMRDRLENELRVTFPSLLINGHPVERLPHLLSISFDSRRVMMEGEMLLMNMDLKGIAVASGSACTSGSVQPSHVLLAMGRDQETAKATLRFAFGRSNTDEDIRITVRALQETLQQMTGSPGASRPASY